MSKKNLPVILLPDVEGGYSVFIPLFPSCTTQGETAEEALRNAKEALELLLDDPSEDDLECFDILTVSHVVVGQVEVEVPDRVSANIS